MPELIVEDRPVARKSHWCYDCRCEIPKGTQHVKTSVKNEDEFYSLRHHSDCYEASKHYLSSWSPWDLEDGVPPLVDAIMDSGDGQADLDRLRGRFPHVVCRIELADQLLEIHWEAMGLLRGG